MSSKEHQARFASHLSKYQRYTFALLLYPLMTSIFFIVFNNGANGLALRMSYSLIFPSFGLDWGVWGYVFHLLLLVGFSIAIIFGARGSIVATDIAISMHFADFVLLLVLIPRLEIYVWVISLLLHAAFAVSSAFAEVHYYKYRRYLRP